MRKIFGAAFILVIALSGCGSSEVEDSVVKLSMPEEDPYSETFRMMGLGQVMVLGYEFQNTEYQTLHLEAEHYVEGTLQEGPAASFGFGNIQDNATEDGLLGLGLINPGETGETFIIFSNDGSTRSASESPQLLSREEAGASTWSTAVDNEQELELSEGEEKILAVYRQTGEDGFEAYDLTEESAAQMIEEDRSVLFLTAEVKEEEE